MKGETQIDFATDSEDSVFNDSENIAPCSFLSITEDGTPVDFGCHPYTEGEGDEQQDRRERYLPHRHTKGDAEEHGNGRSEGDEGKPSAETARRRVEHGRQEEHGEQKRHSHR